MDPQATLVADSPATNEESKKTNTRKKAPSRNGRRKSRKSDTRRVRVGDVLLTDPHLDRDLFPLNEDLIEDLRESFRSTGVWGDGRLLVREPEDGNLEPHFGSHLLEAMRREFGDDHKITVTIDNVDDETLYRRRVDENVVRRKPSALLDQEQVFGLVQRIAAGAVSVEPPHPNSPKSTIRVAPSFIQGELPGPGREALAYTVTTVADVLGWERTRTEETLSALELREKEIVRPEVYSDLNTKQARVVTAQARKIHNAGETEAKTCEQEAAETDDETERTQLLEDAEDARVEANKRADRIARRISLKMRDGKWGHDDAEVERRLADLTKSQKKPDPAEKPSEDGEPSAQVTELINLVTSLPAAFRVAAENIESLSATDAERIAKAMDEGIAEYRVFQRAALAEEEDGS